jgi:cysteinyl-tRNA synthetase
MTLNPTPVRVYDTLSGEKRLLETLEPGKIRMYACGVTPYDNSHIGHGRCYVAFDVIYRYLRQSGLQVTYVRNFTDVDDKIINRANERGIAAVDLAEENIQSFYRDMDALGIARPDHEPRVSTSMPQIIALVQTLIERGVAYASEGDVYYAVSKFPTYGKLGKRTLDDMQAGARVEVSDKKQHPMDFALWKAAKPGEPAWESPWGKGRPGWHIECSAMSMNALGECLDIHCGGQDLIFPHHENEIAQSEGATGRTFSNHWLHNGFVNVDNEKMSKSLGNFFTIKDVLQRYEPQVLRLFYLSTHYHNPINFSDFALDEAAERVAYFYETLRKLEIFLDQTGSVGAPFGPLPGEAFLNEFEARFREAMDDDFNTVRVLGQLAEAFKLANELLMMRKAKQLPNALAAARQLRDKLTYADEVLQLFGAPPADYLERHKTKAAARRGLSLDWIAEKVGDRLIARSEKNWAEADRVRDELLAAGVVLMDGPQGTDWMVSDVRAGAVEGVAGPDAG